MNIDTILVTTRLYYSIQVQPNDLIEIDSAGLIHFAELVQETEFEKMKKHGEFEKMSVSNSDDFDPYADSEDGESNTEEGKTALDFNAIIKKLFVDGGSADDDKSYNGFWEKTSSRLCLKRILLKKDDKFFTIFIAPCFPTNYNKNNLRIRHEYLKTIFGRHLSKKSLLIAHDKDLYLENDERCLKKEDCKLATDSITEDLIPLCQVYGFQHVYEPNRIYSVFISKLGELTFESCLSAIEIIESEIRNRTIYQLIDSYPFTNDGNFKIDGNVEEITNLIDSLI